LDQPPSWSEELGGPAAARRPPWTPRLTGAAAVLAPGPSSDRQHRPLAWANAKRPRRPGPAWVPRPRRLRAGSGRIYPHPDSGSPAGWNRSSRERGWRIAWESRESPPAGRRASVCSGYWSSGRPEEAGSTRKGLNRRSRAGWARRALHRWSPRDLTDRS